MKMIKLRLLLRVLLKCVYVVSRNFLTAVMDTENFTASKRRITSPDGDTVAVRKKSCSSASSPSGDGDGHSKKNLRSQDLVQLRKDIEKGNLDMVRYKIWANSRYLISSGDRPSILQEGARYNALHVAAKNSNADMAALIIDTLADTEFIEQKFGDCLEMSCRQRSSILLDLYLNTPDKGLHETPLHIACKLGAVRVVEVFVNVPECNRQQLNKEGLAPADIICSRKTPCESAAEEIRRLLRDTFFVPVLRSPTQDQPEVGAPFSATTPLVTTFEVSAFAGPMELEQAKVFYNEWKALSSRVNRPVSVARLSDFNRGLEREGRDLARLHNVKWKEFWPFLGIYTDLGSLEGLTALEQFFKSRFCKQPTASSPTCVRSLALTNRQIPAPSTQTPTSVRQPNYENSTDESDEEFFTPPSSVPDASSDEDVFEPPGEITMVFINGIEPSKMDIDVLRACESSLLCIEKFPFIWRWRHQIQIYSEQEKESWRSPRVDRMSLIPSATVTSTISPVIKRKLDPLSWISTAPPFMSQNKTHIL